MESETGREDVTCEMRGIGSDVENDDLDVEESAESDYERQVVVLIEGM